MAERYQDIHAKRSVIPRGSQPYIYLIIIVLASLINTLLARFGVLTRPIGPGSSGLYFSVAFMVVFALWFGWWGVISAYIGCFIGAGVFTGMPFAVNAYWSLADVWQVLIPVVAFTAFDADIGLRTRSDFLIFLGFGWLINNAVGAGWGASALALGKLIPWEEVPGVFTGWFTGNLIVTIVISPLLLRYATPHVRKLLGRGVSI